MINDKERQYLQDLAKRYKALCDTDENNQKRQQWYDINDLKSGTKPVFINHYWPLALSEIFPNDSYFCENEDAKEYELQLKTRLFYAEDLQDDNVMEPVIHVRQIFTSDEYQGLVAERKYSDHGGDSGAYEMVPVLNEEEDIDKILLPIIEYDRDASLVLFEDAQEIFEPILTVIKRPFTFAAKIPDEYSWLRGLENTYMDIYDNPEWMHKVLGKIKENFAARFEMYEQAGLWGSLDNSEPLGSAGLRYASGVPDFHDVDDKFNHKVKVADSWGFTCAEVFHCVSNDMHDEFGFDYDREIMKIFKYINIGCCEVLDKKIDYCRTIPNARKISVAEWCDVENAAKELKGDYVYSYRAAGIHFVPDEWDKENAEKELRAVLANSKKYGCNTEIVLNIGGTLGKNPRKKVIEWSKLTRDLIKEYYG